METIGQLIEREVRKQNLSITKFADMIFCERNNVYNIFRRSKIDIVQLGLISKVLHHNFFEDIVKNPELSGMNNSDSINDLKLELAVARFQKYVPKILNEMNRELIISFGCPKDISVVSMPDFYLAKYEMAFTIGHYYRDIDEVKNCEAFAFKERKNEDGLIIYDMINLVYGSRTIDINIDLRTYEEWENLLRFAFEIRAIDFASDKYINQENDD